MTPPEQETTPLRDRATTVSVGARLKARREQMGLTIEQAAQQLKLTKTQVSAIERDAFDSLPGNTFARGFVRNYARLLEIDPAPILEDLSAWLPAERVQTALPKVHEEESFSLGSGTGRAIQLWLVILVGLIIGAGAVFWFLQQPVSPQLDVPQVASAASAVVAVAEVASEAATISMDDNDNASAASAAPVVGASAVAEASAASAVVAVRAVASSASAARASAPKAAASAVVGNGELRLQAEADSWVQIFDANGTKLVSEIVKQGESRVVGGVPPYRVKIGNAPKTRLYLRGQQVDLTTYTKTDVATLELK
ncbi:Cytoskeleton protein RodZ [Andreprevotia sp. IGB-42]|uniref:RodZ domain-containing protein n=1 Tax=Andreprevotia sp. IGB-42 TaxID=2497473 RepID=UPI0013570680|nr:RodZ domain-containing protein [Andreprevotia sp. IGB-42]KAF0814329.1 Cytoskeleton protein RodZ [Andreprevotia sp. IGB-42]